MGVERAGKTEEAITLEGIQRFYGFLKRMNLPTSMGEVGIDDSQFEAMAKRATRFGTSVELNVGNFVKLDCQDIINIYQLVNKEKIYEIHTCA